MLELFPICKKLNVVVAYCDRFAAFGECGDDERRQMVIGVVFAGVMAGMGAVVVSVAVGQPIETTLLAYMTAGLIGSLGFVAMAARQEADVKP